MSAPQIENSLDPDLVVDLPHSVGQAMLSWLASSGYRLQLDEWLTTGNTKAKVAVVVASGPKPPSKLIIKFCPPDRLTAREPRLHAEALSSSPMEFAHQHLTDMPFDPIESDDKWRILFQSIAGDSLRRVRPLESVLHDEQLPELIATIARILLNEWNAEFETRRVKPQALLKGELGTKAERNGPLARFSQEQSIESKHWLRFAGDPATIVPNAIEWSLKADIWPADTPSSWIHFGNVHGDLHPGNVLIRVDPNPEAERFRLIDMSCYSADGSIARDFVHIGLSVLNEYFLDTSMRRRQLLAIALGDASHVPLELHGLRATIQRLHEVANERLSLEMAGMRDDWDDQMALALVAEALEFVGRKSLPTAKRLWFLELACTALGRYLDRHELGGKPTDPARVPLVGSPTRKAVEDAVESILEMCDGFRGTRTTICIVSESVPSVDSGCIGQWPWTTIISFDPELDNGGALTIAKAADRRLHRLVVMDQRAQFAHGSTTWLALGGLADTPGTVVTEGQRTWRRAYRRTLEQALNALGRFSSRPITTLVFGEPDDRVRTVVETIDDRFAARGKIVLVSERQGDLQGYADFHFEVKASEVLAALPDYEIEPQARSAVPGHKGPVVMEPQDEQWIREAADLVDLSAGADAGQTAEVGRGFLRGRLITWFELGLGLDMIPSVANELLNKVREDLDARDTLRISLFHYPGAGGTTLARRTAWEMHRSVPTLYCPSLQDDAGLAQRISLLNQITGLSILVVLEQTTDVVADRLFNRLRGDSVSAVLLIVSRRARPPKEVGQRTFYLSPLKTSAEVADLAHRYAEYAPHRRRELQAVRPNGPLAVPFYFGLLAFEDEYEGLEEYVRHALSDISSPDHDILIIIALIHRYAGVSVAADLFADILNIAPDRPVQLERSVGDSALGLLMEDEPGFWRTAHWLVAAEAIRQLLESPNSNDSESWRIALSGMASRIIDEALVVFGDDPPDDIRDVLNRLFIVRDNREYLDDSRTRSFSEFLETIPSLNGRLEVLHHLAESFPNEPHYWAHYGRLLSYELGDSHAALEALDKALTLDNNDSVLYHIRGMVHSRRLRNLGEGRSDHLDETELRRITELALADFDEAARLKDDSEYPYVAAAQVAITAIETAYRRSGCTSHAEFFGRPTSDFYRSLLEQAEAAIDAIGEINGGDQPSGRAEEATTGLAALYDDYSTLLQGWRNLLDREDVYKVPIRRRLVRAYFRRAGSWAKLPPSDLDRVRILLEENLRDDPSDSGSLRDWLRVARFGDSSLDRASELVSYWASQSVSRDALYYDYVLAALQVFGGRDSVARETQRKIERCRDRTSGFGNRKFSYEWLGDGHGLEMLVHYSELPQVWDRNNPDEVPNVLRRVRGRVARIGSPQAGTLRLDAGGLDAFFVPARAGVLRNRHENSRVDAVIGFSYDGLRAWAVRLSNA